VGVFGILNESYFVRNSSPHLAVLFVSFPRQSKTYLQRKNNLYRIGTTLEDTIDSFALIMTSLITSGKSLDSFSEIW